MLKSGIFTTPTEQFTTYVIDEPGFYRIDFVKGNAAFNVDYDAVVYSQVRRKKVYTYGDSKIYDEYLRIEGMNNVANYRTQKEATWDDGKYIVTVSGEDRKLNIKMTSRSENGTLMYRNILYNGYGVAETVIDPIYVRAVELQLLPATLNI